MDDAALKSYLLAASALTGLPLRAEDFPDILAAFKTQREQAALFEGFLLPEDTEPAPRFRP